MKFNTEIKEYLKKHININQSRLDNARSKVSWSTDEEKKWSLVKFLENNIDWDIFLWTSYQWSMSYFTVIKPHPDNDNWQYDVDVAVKLKYNSDRDNNEKEYYNLVYNCLKNSDRYKDKVINEKERAIRVSYDSNDGEFYVDIVPMFKKDDNWRVINSKENTKEISWGFLFRDWVNEKNNKTSVDWSTEKFLKKIIRIYKFFKNEWHISHIKSVQITLLLAKQVEKLNEEHFWDISSTLYYISKKLKEELEECDKLEDLNLENPQLPKEIFNRWFNEEEFQELKESLIEHIDKITNAYEESDEEKSLELWQYVFWEDFGNKIKINKNMYLSIGYEHAEKPFQHNWNKKIDCKKILIIWTHNKSNRNIFYNKKPIRFSSGQNILTNQDLYFYAKTPRNLWNCILYRQITNEKNKYVENLRWKIANESKWIWYNTYIWWYWIYEYSKRQWKHWIKCYLVNEYKEIVAESDEFIVNII